MKGNIIIMEHKRNQDANLINEKYIESLVVEQRIIDSVKPSLKTNYFGSEFDMPILTPAFSHIGNINGREKTGLYEYSVAARNLNMLNFVGMMENEGFKDIMDAGAKTVRIVKPYADNGKVLDQFAYAKEIGAFGIGIDIDHIFANGGYDVVIGEEMAPQSSDMIKNYIDTYKLPFVVKGVLSVPDAVKCKEIGASAIIVSHHHGRMPSAIPPMMILPEIKKALEGSDVKLFLDCQIATGMDVFKALALGADGVAPGRAMMDDLNAEGTTGVEKFIRGMADELMFAMGNTGFDKVENINDSVIHRLNG